MFDERHRFGGAPRELEHFGQGRRRIAPCEDVVGLLCDLNRFPRQRLGPREVPFAREDAR
jgi:hypothetical protein